MASCGCCQCTCLLYLSQPPHVLSSQPLYILSLQGLADGAWTSRTGRKDWVQRLKNTTDVRDLAKAALEFEMALRREVLNLAWHSSDSFQRAAKRRGRKSKVVLEKERERQARQSDIDFDELRRAGVRSIRTTNLQVSLTLPLDFSHDLLYALHEGQHAMGARALMPPLQVLEGEDEASEDEEQLMASWIGGGMVAPPGSAVQLSRGAARQAVLSGGLSQFANLVYKGSTAVASTRLRWVHGVLACRTVGQVTSPTPPPPPSSRCPCAPPRRAAARAACADRRSCLGGALTARGGSRGGSWRSACARWTTRSSGTRCSAPSRRRRSCPSAGLFPLGSGASIHGSGASIYGYDASIFLRWMHLS